MDFYRCLFPLIWCFSPYIGAGLIPEKSTDFPHCTRTTVLTGEVTEQNFDTTQVTVSTTVELDLGLKETACFYVNLDNSQSNSTTEGYTYNGSLMYMLQYSELAHHHPINGKYQFGIPLLQSHCICDCAGGDDHCTASHRHSDCSKGSYCLSTYYANRKNVGCPLGGESDVCCKIAVTPYQNRLFWALDIGQADTIAVFKYKIYTFENGKSILTAQNNIQVPLDTGQTFTLGRDKLELHVKGSMNRQPLASKMYFVESTETRIRTGPPVNHKSEKNWHRLGWFRRNHTSKEWTVVNGFGFQTVHHVKVEDCKLQKYTENYLANYFATKGENGNIAAQHVYLGKYVEENEKSWIKKAIIPFGDTSRQAIVLLRKSPKLTLKFAMDSHASLKFYHHNSRLKDFFGSINLDKHSNRFMNITFLESQGSLLGKVYFTNNRDNEQFAFSTYIGSAKPSNRTHILVLPSNVNSSRWVCIHPSRQPDLEKCKLLKFYETPLEWYTVSHQWSLNQGKCEGCNEIGVKNFLQYLNPKQWFDGFNSTSETIAFIFEMVIYFIVILVIVILLRKCACPLVKCLLCTGGKTKKITV